MEISIGGHRENILLPAWRQQFVQVERDPTVAKWNTWFFSQLAPWTRPKGQREDRFSLIGRGLVWLRCADVCVMLTTMRRVRGRSGSRSPDACVHGRRRELPFHPLLPVHRRQALPGMLDAHPESSSQSSRPTNSNRGMASSANRAVEISWTVWPGRWPSIWRNGLGEFFQAEGADEVAEQAVLAAREPGLAAGWAGRHAVTIAAGVPASRV